MKLKYRDGTVTDIVDGQEKTIKLLYGNIAGRILLKVLTAPILSKMAGSFLSTKASCIFVKSFISRYSIDMSQYEDVKYNSYNEFFARKIRSELRPIDYDPNHFISPCDSKLTVLSITDDLKLKLKNTWYTVESLLKNAELAKQYKDGYAMIFRLTVDDYHRYCYVDNGEKENNIYIPGVLHTVNPIANDYYPIYKENSREYSILHSENFGDIVMMEVGALLVGKIVNHHQQTEVKRGQEKGFFQFGGSTVVLFVKPDVLKVDNDIIEASQQGIETAVKYGEKIGELKNI